jgi:hypothetical protein
MILKHKDDVTPHLEELERLLECPALTKRQREELEEELWMIKAGAKGEKEAAYHIDFHWKDGVNSIVIHDLRIEHNGRVAQIDHLILHRTLECHVLESKAFGTGIRISEASEWEVRTRYGWRGMPSPVEQNRRHIEVLKSFIRDHQLAPKRLGLSMPISFHNWVLVSPECRIQREGKGFEGVVKMDLFEKEFLKRNSEMGVIDTFTSISKLVSLSTIEELGRKLIAAHKPASFDFAGKFGIALPDPNDDSRFAPPAETQVALPPQNQVTCAICSVVLEQKVIDYCQNNPNKFNDRLLCRKCQKVPVPPACDGCGSHLEQKVINFCRLNSKRFGGKKLCRGCQGAAV